MNSKFIFVINRQGIPSLRIVHNQIEGGVNETREVILEEPNKGGGSRNGHWNKLKVGSQVKVEKNPQTRKHGESLTEDEFYSIIQEELRKKGLRITSDIAIVKDMTLEERRKEAEKPLYLARYE